MSTVKYGDERLPERFWIKTEVQSNGCWLWTKGKNPKRYGNFWKAGTNRPAHRVAYEALTGPIPDGADVRHDCDTPSCVNPNHLRTGTHSDNMQDCLQRGRNPQASKKFCLQGHPYSEENTYVRPSGARTCRACQRDAVKRYQRRNIGAPADQAGAA